jgi:hypothetical protein
LPDSGHHPWNLTNVTEFRQSGTFGDRFGLPTNFNFRWWRIPTNVRARMKSLNSENDLLFSVNCFAKIKRGFYSQIENDLRSITIIFGCTKHRKIQKKYFTPKQTKHQSSTKTVLSLFYGKKYVGCNSSKHGKKAFPLFF